ncbi:MAG: histidine kinase [Treponema sp.]|nr:histidine kinase [Treponema sp.]
MHAINIALHQLMLNIMLICFLNIVLQKEIRRVTSKFLIYIFICNIVSLASFIIEYALLELLAAGRTDLDFVVRLVCCIICLSYYGVLALFVYYFTSYISLQTKVSWTLAHISLAICVIFSVGLCASAFNGMFFYIKDGHFFKGEQFWFSQLGGYFVIGTMLFLSIRYFKVLGKWDSFLFMSFAFFPLLSTFTRSVMPYFSVQLALSISILLIYNFVYLTQVRKNIKQEDILRENRIALSFSQIQPHFIFNTLNSIYVLCDKDPKIVKQAIGDFSSYLRTNLEVFSEQRMIPFEKEIEHLNCYINLEKLRFREDLYVNYDFLEKNFMIPQLTLQPIVENAIKHGILKKKSGGVVTISTCKTDQFYKIKVSDDGVGFDTNQLNIFTNNSRNEEKNDELKNLDNDSTNQSNLKKDGQLHVGLKNVQERLWIMCRGNLIVKSEIGKGTSVVIELPLKTQQDFSESKNSEEIQK